MTLEPATASLLEALSAKGASDKQHKEEYAQEAFKAAQSLLGSEAAMALQAYGERLSQSDPNLGNFMRQRQDLAEQLVHLDARLDALVSRTGNFGESGEETKLHQQLEETQAKLKSLESARPSIGKKFDELALMPTVNFNQVASVLQNDEALLLIVTTGEKTFTFAVTPETVVWNQIPLGGYAIARKVATLRCGTRSI